MVTIHPEADGGWSIDEIVREGRLTLAESQALRRFYEEELESYAYLDLP